MHAGAQFSLYGVTVRAEREDGPLPAARVTWSSTAPPQCVLSFTVEFRTESFGSIEKSYNTTNTSQTEVIQTGLQANTSYYIRVVVTGVSSLGRLISNQVQVLVGGKVTTHKSIITIINLLCQGDELVYGAVLYHATMMLM